MRKVLLGAATVAVATLGMMAPVAAKGGAGGGGTGGGGGGGTTPVKVVNGAIGTVSQSITCSAGTVLTVTLQKGFDKRVEVVVTPTAGAVNADGTPAPSAWWDQGVLNLSVLSATGAPTSLGSWGGNINLNPGLRQTVLLAGVRPGTTQLRYWAQRRTLPSTTSLVLADIKAQPVVETCSGTYTVVAK